MDAKLKALWLEALRSGNYKQTSNELFDGEGYCCLGVLCDVMLENGLTPGGVAIRKTKDSITAGGSQTDLPYRVQVRIGLPPEVHSGAIRRNDGTDKDLFPDTPQTFAEIADWLQTAVPTDEPKA